MLGPAGAAVGARGTLRSVVAALAVAALLAACSGGDVALDPLPPPPSTQARPSTTSPPDFTGVALPAVPAGRATMTTVVVGPGKGTIKGTVVGPDGTPVDGATIRVERLVGRSVAGIDVASAPDGSWSAQNVLGGGYRVRAWRVPDIAIAVPAFFFVGATETYSVDLKLERNFGTTPQPAIAPNPPVVGGTSNLVLQLSNRSVDPGGVVNGVAMAGATVELAGGSGWSVGLANPTVTDATGRARWELTCQGVGVQALRLVVNGAEQFQLALPACADPPTPVTTAPVASTVPGATTSRPPGSTTPTTSPVTTTTRPAVTTAPTTRPVTTTTGPAVTTVPTTRPVTTTTTRKP